MLRLLSPAKINLFLYVTGIRDDGYHTLETLMCPVGLYDEVTLSFEGEGIRIRGDHPAVSWDAGNLAHRAASLFLAGLPPAERGGVAISIEKRIPVGAGLGGGSSNAATVLSGMNRHYGFPYAQDDLAAMGATLGADVPFFVLGKPALATGIGTDLELLPALSPFSLVLVYPEIMLSTAKVYQRLNLGLTNIEKKNRRAIFSGGAFDPAGLHNDLELPAMSICPEIRPLKEALLACGADGALMSGSGSSVFGLFSDSECAAEAEGRLRRQYGYQTVFLAESLV